MIRVDIFLTLKSLFYPHANLSFKLHITNGLLFRNISHLLNQYSLISWLLLCCLSKHMLHSFPNEHQPWLLLPPRWIKIIMSYQYQLKRKNTILLHPISHSLTILAPALTSYDLHYENNFLTSLPENLALHWWRLMPRIILHNASLIMSLPWLKHFKDFHFL